MMGPATAVVEISSDDEDGWRAPGAGNRNSTDGGWRTPGAGKHPPDGGWRTPDTGKDKSSEDGLEWVEKLLDGDCDAIGEGLDDSEKMQEFFASLMDATGIAVDAKKSLVDEPEEKRPCDAADDDDDDCVILDADPEKAVAVAAAKEEGPRCDAAEDELLIVAEKGELACRDFPHPRHLCASLSFNTSSHASHCSMCHCYVCDSPAPCALWGKGTRINDHCHATDKDPKWKKLRQLSKRKSEQAPKLGGVQNLLQSSSTTSAIPSTGKFPLSSTVSQIQQMHPSIMVSQNLGQGIIRPRAPSPMPRAPTPSNRSKRARVAPPAYTPLSVNYMQPFVPCYNPMQPAFPHGFQTTQVPPGDTFWSFPDLPPTAPYPLSAASGSQGYQRQALPYPQMPPNTVVGTGVPLLRCISLSTQGKQSQQGPSTDTCRTLRDVLTNLAHELGVADYNNTDPPVGQQSASTPQTLYPNQLLAQAKACQGININPNNVAGQAPLRIRLPSRHNSSNRASDNTVISSDAIQAWQPLCQLNSQSSLVPNETTPSTIVRSLPWNAGST